MIISEMTERRIFNLADDKGNEILFGDVSDTENNLILDKEGFLKEDSDLAKLVQVD